MGKKARITLEESHDVLSEALEQPTKTAPVQAPTDDHDRGVGSHAHAGASQGGSPKFSKPSTSSKSPHSLGSIIEISTSHQPSDTGSHPLDRRIFVQAEVDETVIQPSDLTADGSPKELEIYTKKSLEYDIKIPIRSENSYENPKFLSSCSTRLFTVLSGFQKQDNLEEKPHKASGSKYSKFLEDQRNGDRKFLQQIGVAMEKHHSTRRLPVPTYSMPGMLPGKDPVLPTTSRRSARTKPPATAVNENSRLASPSSPRQASPRLKPKPTHSFQLNRARTELVTSNEEMEDIGDLVYPSLLPELLPNCSKMDGLRKIDVKNRVCTKFVQEQVSDFMKQEAEVIVDENGSRKTVHTNPAMIEMCRLLRLIGLFQEYTEQQMFMLLRNMHIIRTQPNKWLFHKGDNPQDPVTGGFYVIIHGSIKVFLDEDQPPVATKETGDSFGDMALLNDAPRNASIFTSEPCIFGCIRKDDFMRYRHHADQIWALSAARFLQGTEAFGHWELKSLICFAGMARSKVLEPGKSFYPTDEMGHWVLIMRSGECQVVRTLTSKRRVALPRARGPTVYEDVENNSRVVVAHLQRGDVFGDKAALATDDSEAQNAKEAIRGCEFVAVIPGEAFLIDTENFRRCCKKWGYTAANSSDLLSVDELEKKARETSQWKKFRQDFVHGIMKEKDIPSFSTPGLLRKLWSNGKALKNGTSSATKVREIKTQNFKQQSTVLANWKKV